MLRLQVLNIYLISLFDGNRLFITRLAARWAKVIQLPLLVMQVCQEASASFIISNCTAYTGQHKVAQLSSLWHVAAAVAKRGDLTRVNSKALTIKQSHGSLFISCRQGSKPTASTAIVAWLEIAGWQRRWYGSWILVAYSSQHER